MDTTTVEQSRTRVFVERRELVTYLIFEFHGQFTASEAERAVGDWDASLVAHPGPKVYVWDTLDMRDYEIAARHVWQDALSRHRASIERVVLVTERSSFRIGAKIMASLLRLPLSVVAAPEHVDA